MLNRWSFFSLGFKDDDVSRSEKHFERKDGASFSPLTLSSSLANSHLQGSLLQIRWHQCHFPSIQQYLLRVYPVPSARLWSQSSSGSAWETCSTWGPGEKAPRRLHILFTFLTGTSRACPLIPPQQEIQGKEDTNNSDGGLHNT